MTAPPIPNLDTPQYVNQYDEAELGINLYVRRVLTDAEGPVSVKMVDFASGGTVFEREAENKDVGQYTVWISAKDSSKPGAYFLYWSFTQEGEAQEIQTMVTVGKYNATIAALAPPFRDLVERVWVRFADMFDSPAGGPNLQTYYQSGFNLGRIADLMLVGLGKLNTIAQPHQTYTLDGAGGTVFPLAQWGPLLEAATYIEVLRHLRRSYLEQPSWMGPEVTRLDRRDYFDRWGQVLNEEEASFKSQTDIFKIAGMNLGRPATLVSGGAYPRGYGSNFLTGLAAARGYWFWNRIA